MTQDKFVIRETASDRIDMLQTELARLVGQVQLASFAKSLVIACYPQLMAAWSEVFLMTGGDELTLAERRLVAAEQSLRQAWPGIDMIRVHRIITAYRQAGLIDELVETLAAFAATVSSDEPVEPPCGEEAG